MSRRTPDLRMSSTRPIGPRSVTTKPLNVAATTRDDSQDSMIRSLQERVAQLEQVVGQLASHISVNSANELVIQSSQGVFIQAPGALQITASRVQLSAAMFEISAAMTKTSGVIQTQTIIANSVVSSSYTPGAGNIW